MNPGTERHVDELRQQLRKAQTADVVHALLVQESRRWVGLMRTVFLLPVALGLASASLVAAWYLGNVPQTDALAVTNALHHVRRTRLHELLKVAAMP